MSPKRNARDLYSGDVSPEQEGRQPVHCNVQPVSPADDACQIGRPPNEPALEARQGQVGQGSLHRDKL